MIIKHNKEKAYNAIIYFNNHTTLCNKKKIYKLLYLLDFEIFNETGRSVTDYDYYAWKMGPVPKELHNEIQTEDLELKEYFDIETTQGKRGYEPTALINKKSFENKYFTRRELAKLKELVDRFSMSTANEMEEYTHSEHLPWHRVWNEEKKQNEKIPYEYNLINEDELKQDTIRQISKEREEFLNTYK